MCTILIFHLIFIASRAYGQDVKDVKEVKEVQDDSSVISTISQYMFSASVLLTVLKCYLPTISETVYGVSSRLIEIPIHAISFFIQEFFNPLFDLIVIIMTPITGLLHLVLLPITGRVGVVVNLLSKPLNGVGDFVNMVLSPLKYFGDWFRDLLSPVLGNLTRGLDILFKPIAYWLNRVLNTLRPLLGLIAPIASPLVQLTGPLVSVLTIVPGVQPILNVVSNQLSTF